MQDAQHQSDSAKQQVVAIFRALATRYRDNAARIAQIQAEQAELARRVDDCYAAARLLGFDVIAEAAADGAPPPAAPLSQGQASQPPLPLTQAAPSSINIKKFIIDAAQSAYPNPIRATDIRKKLADRGIQVHEKTVGMSLYRLSKQHIVQRNGVDWFFVQPQQRKLLSNTKGSGVSAPEVDPFS